MQIKYDNRTQDEGPDCIQDIKRVREYKYLGVILNNTMKLKACKKDLNDKLKKIQTLRSM